MANVLIIGGGFAGVWAAAGAVRTYREAGLSDSTLRVTCGRPGDDMVIRPRLYEPDPQRMRVPLDRVLGPIGVRRVAATVTGIDVESRTVVAVGRDGSQIALGYDRLVLAAGSRVVRPTIDGAEHLFDVDTMPAAAALHAHVVRLPAAPYEPGRFTAVVVGAGFTGLEVATELVDRLRAVANGRPVGWCWSSGQAWLGRSSAMAPARTSSRRSRRPAWSPARGAGRRARRGGCVALRRHGHPRPHRGVDGGDAGQLATEQVPAERDAIGRLRVDEFLEVVGVPGVYAAGDTAAAVAEPGHVVMQSCQHAVPQGKFVGVNVASDLLGRPRVPFAPDPYVTCLDLGSYGAVLTAGWDRAVQQSRHEAKDLKRSINAEWIYPPVDDADTIVLHADHRTTWPTAALAQ